MQRKLSPVVLSLVSLAMLACSGTPATTASAASSPQQPAQQAPPSPQQPQHQQSGPPPEPHYTPNCAGCTQLSEADSLVVIKAQRAMMSLQSEWQDQVKQMNDKFAAQQKVIADKLDAIRKEKKIPADYVFDYQNIQFVPAPKAPAPPAK